MEKSKFIIIFVNKVIKVIYNILLYVYIIFFFFFFDLISFCFEGGREGFTFIFVVLFFFFLF